MVWYQWYHFQVLIILSICEFIFTPLTVSRISVNSVFGKMTLRCVPEGLKLIVFDLDYTLWPYHVDSTVSLPFHVKESKILDQSGQEIRPFPESQIVLNYLSDNGFRIGAASRTTKPNGAHQLLELLDWNKHFTLKEIYPGCKVTHFKRFKDQTNVPYSSMLFFDDEQRNIREVSELGVKCVFVQDGMNMELLHEAINLFKS